MSLRETKEISINQVWITIVLVEMTSNELRRYGLERGLGPVGTVLKVHPGIVHSANSVQLCC